MTSHGERPIAEEMLELVNLLTCRELDTDEVAGLARSVLAAHDDPDLSWLTEANEFTTFGLYRALSDYIASGDKEDELIEEIEDFFEEPFDLNPLNDDEAEDKANPRPLIVLRNALAQRGRDRGGYDLVFLDGLGTDDANVFVVLRPDLKRIIELGRYFSVRLDRIETIYSWEYKS